MQSKKYRPIVMNRNKAPGKTYSILKKAALITALLALIEVIVLVIIHYKKTDKVVAAKQEQTKTAPKVVVPEAPKKVVSVPPVVVAENKPKDSVVEKDTVVKKAPVEMIKPVAKELKPTETKIAKDTVATHEIKPKVAKATRKISDAEMFQILNEVRKEKLKSNNTANCISIQIVNISNAENGSMIASYLRKNGYIISGREVINGTRKGIHIDAAGPCLKLAIGSL